MNNCPPSEIALGTATESVPQVAPSLLELERLIELGLQKFLEVGRALAEISARRLHRELGYATFEEYCGKRWGWHRRTAYKYIAAFEVAQNVPSRAHEISYTQARELAVLSPRQQREVASAVDFSTTTVRELHNRIRRARPVKLVAPPADEPEKCDAPPEIIERVRRVLETIDLAPCADPVSGEVSIEHGINSLFVPWAGRIYLSPPCDQSPAVWVEKLCVELLSENVTEAIAVLPAQTDAGWFRLLHDCAICFLEERFDREPRKPLPIPVAVVYFGNNVAGFHAEFQDLGDIWMRWKQSSGRQVKGGAR